MPKAGLNKVISLVFIAVTSPLFYWPHKWCGTETKHFFLFFWLKFYWPHKWCGTETDYHCLIRPSIFYWPHKWCGTETLIPPYLHCLQILLTAQMVWDWDKEYQCQSSWLDSIDRTNGVGLRLFGYSIDFCSYSIDRTNGVGLRPLNRSFSCLQHSIDRTNGVGLRQVNGDG